MQRFSHLLARLGTLLVLLSALLIAPGAAQAFAPPPPAPPAPVDSTTTVVNPRTTSNTLSAVTYGAGTFVAVGYGGTILTSPDGATWRPQTSRSTAQLLTAAYGNGRFVVAGSSGTVLVSSDQGVTWQPLTLPNGGQNVKGAIFSGGKFYLTSQDGYVYSTDGATWPATKSRVDPADTYLLGIATNGSLFVVATESGHIFTSTDLTTWTKQASAPCCPLSVVWSGTQFVATDNQDINSYTSADGLTWTRHSADPVWFTGLAYGAGHYVAGDGNNYTMATSDDGATWTTHDLGGTDMVDGVAFGAGRFVLVGDHGLVAVYTPPAPQVTQVPVITSIGISAPSQATVGASVSLALTTTTNTGEFLLPSPTWTASGGTLVGSGPWPTWTAPTKPGTYTLGASYGSFTASKTLTVVPGPVATVSLSPAGPVTVEAGKSLALTGTAADGYGNPVAAPVWSVTGVGSVTDGAFSSQQAGKATVTLKAGDKSASAQVTVLPGPVAKVAITPAGDQTTETGGALQFSARATDAFGNPVEAPEQWSNTGVGSVTDGRFGVTRPGTATVTVQIGGVKASSGTITVAPGLAPAGTADAGGAPVRIDITPTPTDAYVLAGPVLVQGSGTVSISFPVGQAAGDNLLAYYYDPALKTWIAVPTLVAGGQATARVPAGVPVALMRTGISQPPAATDSAAILKVASLGLMSGFPDGSFGSDQSLTRYQLASVLARLQHLDTAHADLTLLNRLADGAQTPEWARASVAAAMQAGLMTGTDTGFAGAQTLTRAQLAAVVARVLGPSAAPSAGLHDVPAWAQAAVDRVVASGLMPAAADGTFHAEWAVTRGELARVLAALVDQVAPKA